MKVVIQRVTDATVTVENEIVGKTGPGLLALVGFGKSDTTDLINTPIWKKMIDKMINLRIFVDEEGKFNKSLVETGGDLMLVSQFTLYADCKKGRRPSFTNACHPDVAATLFDKFIADVRNTAPAKVETGEFGAEMFLDFTNWGPVTIILDSEEL